MTRVLLIQALPGVLLGLAVLLVSGGSPRHSERWGPGHRALRRTRGNSGMRGRPGHTNSPRFGPRAAPEVAISEVMELLALAIATGSAVVPAIEAVATVGGERRGAELARVAAALAWGYEDRAWAAAGAEWAPVHRALSLAQRAGVPPADLLATAAADLRRDGAARLETAAARLGVRLVVPLGLLFLPAFILTTVIPIVLALATGVLLAP